MATHYSDQLANVYPDAQGRTRRNSPSEGYGKLTSFNVTLNASGSYPKGVTPAPVTYATGDFVELAVVKTVDKVRSIGLLDQTLTGASGLAFNVGVLYGDVSPKNPISGTVNPGPGTIANATAYAAADTDIDAAHTSPVELAFLNRAPGAINNFVWQDAGLTENPGGTMVIALQITAGTMTVAPDQVSFPLTIINT
jgi:hypothetical protein